MISYQEERAADVIEDIKPLLQAHWEEIARHKDKIALNPDYQKYIEIEKQGMLHIATMREDGRLVGYCISFLVKSIHYGDSIWSLNDILFVAKEYRKGFAAIRLLKFMEEKLKERGVQNIHLRMKLEHGFQRLLERLGYVQIELTYEKFLC